MKFRIVLLSVVLLCLEVACFAESELENKFIDPPFNAGPHTWWHWMNGNVSREGITADLEAMADIGISGAQIFNVGDRDSVNIPAGTADYMSEEWLGLVAYAVKEADRLGMEICMHNCAGWTSSGGPWITPEYAMKKVTYSSAELQGPGERNVQLPMPAMVRGFYRPIAVLAFPTPSNNTYRIPDIGNKAVFGYRYGIDLSDESAPKESVVNSADIVDVSDNVNAEGVLMWDCPAGAWTILRVGYTITGKDNHPAPDPGLGLECDKLSRQALDLHWRSGVQPILDKLGELAGPVMNNLLIDSYEVGLNNWTAGFENEFESLRGYSIMKYLPAICGYVVDSLGISERFLWDYRRTVSDMFRENYYNYFAEKCHDAGLMCSVEPYDGPFECLSIASKADILMGEFWIGNGMNHTVRIASSVAHVYGRKIVGSESFTAWPDQGRWLNHPRTLKATGDSVWCNGVNRFIFHRYAHQPWLDQWPGMTMGQWGTNFDRTNTWWNDGRAWIKYLARSQYLLQEGKFHADILIFGGEFVPNGSVFRPEIKDMGYDYDAIGTDLLEALTVEDGMITLPGGMKYSILVMPETRTMSLKAARKIRQLLFDGATILACRPIRVPSLANYPQAEKELKILASELWASASEDSKTDIKVGKGRLLSGYSLQESLEQINIKPDFEVSSPDCNMNFIHRVINGADVYFVCNQKKEAVSTECIFNIIGKAPQVWDPQYGTIKPALLWHSDAGRTAVNLTLEPEGSCFVVFDKPVPVNEKTFVSIAREGGTVKGDLQAGSGRLEILKAEYGLFKLKPSKIVDLTDVLKEKVVDNKLSVYVASYLGGDPAMFMQKWLQVTYKYDGEEYSAKVSYGDTLTLPPADLPAGKKLVIEEAFYGNFLEAVTRLPEFKVVDVTDKIRDKISDNRFGQWVNYDLTRVDPVVNIPKQIKVTYRYNGIINTVFMEEGGYLTLPSDPWSPSPWPAELCQDNDVASLKVWDEGVYYIKQSDGKSEDVQVSDIPQSFLVEGPWNVQFSSKVKSPKSTVFDKLISLTESVDPEIRGFSGTAIYQKAIDIRPDMLGADKQVMLDLGEVEVMAHVYVNGQDLGVSWKSPYRLDITNAVKCGKNDLKVEVTNLWVNRILADEAYEDDCPWHGMVLAKWPDWLINKQPRPSKRQTFYTWKHWDKSEPMILSGLIGPVCVRTAVMYPIEN